MGRLSVVLVCALALLAAPVAFAVPIVELQIEGTVPTNDAFDVKVWVTTDSTNLVDRISLMQVVFDNIDPSLTLSAAGTTSAYTSLLLVNAPDVVIFDFFPNTYATEASGNPFLAGTIHFLTGDSNTFDLNLFYERDNTSSSALFDAFYSPLWDFEFVGVGVVDGVPVGAVPEPASILLLGIGLAGIGVCRKKSR